MSADAPILIPVPLAWLVTHWRPGSHDWTWLDEYNDLLGDPRTLAIERRVVDEGVGFMDHVAPILLGSDGRVWDGHHRIVLAMKYGIGWVMVEGAVDLAPAPAPSVVPEGAVPNDAAVAAVAIRLYLADRDPKARGAWSALGDGQKSPYRAFAYDLLAAALPHLTAQPAPEASRVDVVSLLVGLGALSPDPAELVADVLLARFVVTDPHEDGCPHTPKASREDLTGVINDAAFEDAARSEHHAEGLLELANPKEQP